MFYDNYVKLCKLKGVAPKRAALDMGLSNSAASTWKRTQKAPLSDTLLKIADYFNVPVSMLYAENPDDVYIPVPERDIPKSEAPAAPNVPPDVLALAQKIEALPPSSRALVDAYISGMLAQMGDK